MSSASMSGFPEWSPVQQLVERAVVERLAATFERWGFSPLRLRSVEPLSVLLAKGETDQEIFAVARRESSAESAGRGLHFDLTVPLARYVTDQRGTLTFPYRRYQIQPVWRGERPQKGRYREFLQADADIVADRPLPLEADGEMLAVLGAGLDAFDLPPVTVKINSRRLIDCIMATLDVAAADREAAMRALDKLPKIGADAVGDLLTGEAGVGADAADRLLRVAAINGEASDLGRRLNEAGLASAALDEAVADVERVARVAVAAGLEHRLVVDMSIMRGLNYYTGTVVEGFVDDWPEMGAICSGGRYDDLAGDADRPLPGMGVSIGLTRILGRLFESTGDAATRRSPSLVLVGRAADDDWPDAVAVARDLRARGLAVEVFPFNDKLSKQFRYAEDVGIRYAVIPAALADSGEIAVRDLASREQTSLAEWLDTGPAAAAVAES